jgi:uncharacterized coiled-coil DUF342 family protein
MEGLNELRQTLEAISNAVQELEGQLTSVQFNPHDEASIEAAISKINAEVDARLAPYRSNAIVSNVAAEVKVKFAEGIRKRAREAEQSKP